MTPTRTARILWVGVWSGRGGRRRAAGPPGGAGEAAGAGSGARRGASRPGQDGRSVAAPRRAAATRRGRSAALGLPKLPKPWLWWIIHYNHGFDVDGRPGRPDPATAHDRRPYPRLVRPRRASAPNSHQTSRWPLRWPPGRMEMACMRGSIGGIEPSRRYTGVRMAASCRGRGAWSFGGPGGCRNAETVVVVDYSLQPRFRSGGGPNHPDSDAANHLRPHPRLAPARRAARPGRPTTPPLARPQTGLSRISDTPRPHPEPQAQRPRPAPSPKPRPAPQAPETPPRAPSPRNPAAPKPPKPRPAPQAPEPRPAPQAPEPRPTRSPKPRGPTQSPREPPPPTPGALTPRRAPSPKPPTPTQPPSPTTDPGSPDPALTLPSPTPRRGLRSRALPSWPPSGRTRDRRRTGRDR